MQPGMPAARSRRHVLPSPEKVSSYREGSAAWRAEICLRCAIVVYGDKESVVTLLAHHTAYVERTHFMSRHSDSRLTRNTLAYTKAFELHRSAVVREAIVYNLICPLKTLHLEVANDLQRRWLSRPSAMAAGLTGCIWTVRELLTTVSVPVYNA